MLSRPQQCTTLRCEHLGPTVYDFYPRLTSYVVGFGQLASGIATLVLAVVYIHGENNGKEIGSSPGDDVIALAIWVCILQVMSARNGEGSLRNV